MKSKAKAVLSASLTAAALLTGLTAVADDDSNATNIPKFVVDPYWPKPLPHRWVTGEVGGICVDSNDHVFGVNRLNLTALELTVGKIPAPPVIEYDVEGNIANSWGSAGVLPLAIHGCFVDFQDNVWIAGNGDGVVQKYSHDGHLLMTIGTKFECDAGVDAVGTPGHFIACTGTGGGNVGKTGASSKYLSLPADIGVDPANGEVYIADGYGNHRVVVFDKNGVYQRQMGTVGSGPGQFTAGDGGHPHCVVLPNNGFVYACDRGQDRINVYARGSGTTPGAFVKEIPIVPGTAAIGTAGSAWDVDFSPDVVQSFMYESDGGNEIMWILDHAGALNNTPASGAPNPAILGGFGRPGHMAGEFTFLHMMAIDSKGNLYAGETIGGRRVQKFTLVVCPGNSQGHGNAGAGECPGNSQGH